MAASAKSKDEQGPSSGAYELLTRPRPAAPSRNLLVRFTEGTLQDILSGKEPAHLCFAADGSPSLRVGSIIHQIKADVEQQAHEVYAHHQGSSKLEPVGYIGQRYAVKQELDQGVQDRMRSRNEAAMAQRESRHIVVLDHEPVASKKRASRQPHGPSQLGRTLNGASTPQRSSSPIGIASPVTTPKPRQPSRLVADGSRSGPTAGRVATPEVSPRVGGNNSQSRLPPPKQIPARQNSASSNDSSNESSAPSSIFTNLSASSASSRTSTSSGDSPPAKESSLTAIAELPPKQTSAVQTTVSRPPPTSDSPPTEDDRPSKSTSTTSLKRKGDVPAENPAPTKKVRTSSTSASDTPQPPRPIKPLVSGRTSGGTKFSRPRKKPESQAMDRVSSSSNSSSSSSTDVALKMTSAQPKRPDTASASVQHGQRKKRRATPEFTSSEDEGANDADADAEGEEEDAIAVVIDHSKVQPLRTAVSNLIAAEIPDSASKSHSTPLQLRDASVEPSAEPPPVKTYTITTPLAYKQHRGRFQIMYKEYERERGKVERMHTVISTLLKGEDVSAEQRKSVWSHKEAQQAMADVSSKAANLVSLKQAIYAYARAHAGQTA